MKNSFQSYFYYRFVVNRHMSQGSDNLSNGNYRMFMNKFDFSFKISHLIFKISLNNIGEELRWRVEIATQHCPSASTLPGTQFQTAIRLATRSVPLVVCGSGSEGPGEAELAQIRQGFARRTVDWAQRSDVAGNAADIRHSDSHPPQCHVPTEYVLVQTNGKSGNSLSQFPLAFVTAKSLEEVCQR